MNSSVGDANPLVKTLHIHFRETNLPVNHDHKASEEAFMTVGVHNHDVKALS